MKLILTILLLTLSTFAHQSKYKEGDCIVNTDADASWSGRTACISTIIYNNTNINIESNCTYVLTFKNYLSQTGTFTCEYVDANTALTNYYGSDEYYEDLGNMTDAQYIGKTLILYREGKISLKEYKRILQYYINHPKR